MDHSPIIFVAGMPRSGSMWTYNVCRQLITAAGKSAWPEEVPQDETPVIQEALSRPPGPGQVYCIKTHFQIPTGKPHMRIICNYRDVRDAMLSYMRFMKCSFDKGMSVARGCMAITDHYLQKEHPDVLPVRYNRMIDTPTTVIRELADYLSLSVSDTAVNEIEGSLSRDAVKRHLAKLESYRQDAGSTPATGEADKKYALAENLDGSARVYEYSTGFQSNHISSGQDGEWRDIFDEEQQAELMAAAADWLKRYGFEP